MGKRVHIKGWDDLIHEVRIYRPKKNDDFKGLIASLKEDGYTLTFDPPESVDDKMFFAEVILHFNKVVGTTYQAKYPSVIGRMIVKLKKAGYTREQLNAVVDLKYSHWKGSPVEKAGNITPNVIFGKKFEGYVGQLSAELNPPRPARTLEEEIDKAIVSPMPEPEERVEQIQWMMTKAKERFDASEPVSFFVGYLYYFLVRTKKVEIRPSSRECSKYVEQSLQSFAANTYNETQPAEGSIGEHINNDMAKRYYKEYWVRSWLFSRPLEELLKTITVKDFN